MLSQRFGHCCGSSYPAARTLPAPAAAPAHVPSQRQTQWQVLAAAKDWHDVTEPLVWRGTEADCLSSSSPTAELSAAWQLMLLSDGSVTRHLQHLSRMPVHVDCLQMQPLDQLQQPSSVVPPACAAIRGPLLQRQVLLRCGDAPAAAPLVYAASWWCGSTVREYLKDDSTPIWVSLSRGHMELYREIQEVQLGHNPALEQLLGVAGPFWSRKYFFWHQDRPLTLIHEVFSPRLSQLLGPSARVSGL